MSGPHSGPRVRAALGLPTVLVFASGCASFSHDAPTPSPIVGVWLVRAPEAPFPLHMFAFHSDGTVEQSNPDAGDLRTSDSNLMGVWRSNADRSGERQRSELHADRSFLLVAPQLDLNL